MNIFFILLILSFNKVIESPRFLCKNRSLRNFLQYILPVAIPNTLSPVVSLDPIESLGILNEANTNT